MDLLKVAEDRGNYAEFEEALKELLPKGGRENEVIHVLEALGWGFRYNAPHNAFTAAKKLKRGFLLKSQVRINIFLDGEKRVKEVKVIVSNQSIFDW